MTNEEIITRLNGMKDYYNDRREPYYVGFDYVDNEAIDMAIKALEQQPCEDCISRAEALRHSHIEYDDDGEGHRVVYVEDIEGLPSVTAKGVTITDFADKCRECGNIKSSITPQQKVTGSWVEKQVVDNEEVEIEQWQSARCSKCDKYHTTPYSYYFDDYKYCPNCGARMEADK